MLEKRQGRMAEREERDRKDYLIAIEVSQENMIHMERLMQGTLQKDELPMTQASV